MRNNELKSILQQIKDVKIMLKIRDVGIEGAFNITKALPLDTVVRISTFYWACDVIDLLTLEKKLIQRFTELVDISELIKITQKP